MTNLQADATGAPPHHPLRVVHVGYFPVGPKSTNQHGVTVKLSNGLIRNGHQVLDFSYRDIARAGNILGSRKLGAGHANRALRDFCRFHRPDLLVLGHADMIATETVGLIRGDLPGLRVLQWNVDPLFEPDNVARIRAKLPVVDATLVSTAGPDLAAALSGCGRVGFMPNPADASLERGRNDLAASLPFDLFYSCGNPTQPKRLICGTEWAMDDFIRMIQGRLPGLRIRLAGFMGAPHISGHAYQDALEQAAMGLNVSRRPDHFLYSSDRLAHMIGNGQVVLMERATGYGTLFTDEQMAFFSSLDELISWLAELPQSPARRMAMARAGRQRYFDLFSETRVARYLAEAAFGAVDPAAYPWPTLI